MIRLALATVIAAVIAMVPATPAAAHGGSDTDLTSDFRTQITAAPDVDGLDVRTVGLDGLLEITWTGTGALVVAGYEGEPYLRFDDNGVSINSRSPAAYLNQDRYAAVELPDTVDPDAEPDWQPASTTRTYQWHDHRTHWMSTTLPPQARQDPDRSHVIYERWEISVTIDGEDHVIVGDLTWAPAPDLLPWLAVTAAIALVAGALLWSRSWRVAAAGLAAVATIALTIDTIGFITATDDNLGNQIWAFAYPALAAFAAVRLAIHSRRHTPDPTLAMMAAGLILGFMGGIDRFDVLTSGFYQSTLDITVARITTVTAFGIGIALTARFLRFLIPLLVRPMPALADDATRTTATTPS
jgi:hypothetical protein